MKAMQEKNTPPTPGGTPSAPLQQECPPHRPYDTAPLLRAVMADDGPLGLAESLDQAYTTLAEYLAADPGTAGEAYAHALYDLRRVRNALLEGSGWLRLKG
ncbi:hypothetical protein SAMN04487941_3921 [Pontibacter akesuensis]|uniref:Uncharacterized protein n=1 Tax=Pontibacter akesuensis TaxID=388950 RepID=A0A1I7KNW7_9BACT|nr:hypothetical protein SAMN04487941_3921 [Pontibacter akesuensis]